MFITILGAGFSWATSFAMKSRLIMSFLATASFILALLATLFLKQRKYEDTWYVGRAVAESIKTRAWSFMMATDLYPMGDPDTDSTKRFVDDLKKIMAEKGDVTFASNLNVAKPEISEAMWNLRGAQLKDRLTAYIKCRIVDQKVWYANKSQKSIEAEEDAYWWMFGSQGAAVMVSIWAIYAKQPTSGFVGVLAAISTAVMAWLQVKKYQETGKAYEIASEELGFAEELGKSVNTESELSKFVRDTESAISREHTLWIARKGVNVR